MACTRKNGLEPVMVIVSVIIPTYNRASFLPLAISSVLAQTYEDFELIVVDDGSTDHTFSVTKTFLKDKRVRYFYQENQGQSLARNHALAQSCGELIAFLDSDDVWHPDKLEKQLKAFDANPEADIVHGDEALIDERGEVISLKNMKRHSGFITPQLLTDNSVIITTALVRRRCFDEMGGFDETERLAEDYELWLRFSVKYRFYYLPGIVALYRVMENQISAEKLRRFEANEIIIARFLENYPSVLSRAEQRSGLARFYCRKARHCASAGERIAAFEAIISAFKNSPLDAIVWRALYRTLVPRK